MADVRVAIQPVRDTRGPDSIFSKCGETPPAPPRWIRLSHLAAADRASDFSSIEALTNPFDIAPRRDPHRYRAELFPGLAASSAAGVFQLANLDPRLYQQAANGYARHACLCVRKL
jgi:hypothetical protein